MLFLTDPTLPPHRLFARRCDTPEDKKEGKARFRLSGWSLLLALHRRLVLWTIVAILVSARMTYKQASLEATAVTAATAATAATAVGQAAATAGVTTFQ